MSLLRTPERKEEDSSDPDGLSNLLSMEKLDRTSPELWPEKIPGVNDFLTMSDTPIHMSPPSWTRGLTQNDINTMRLLGTLSTNGLIAEIKKLQDETYKLGLMESKEMTRGKLLNIFAPQKRNSK